jgi:hypothetical protein
LRTEELIAHSAGERPAAPDHRRIVFRPRFMPTLARVGWVLLSLFLGADLTVGQQRPAAQESAPQTAAPKSRNGQGPDNAFNEKLRSLPPEQQEKFLKNNRYFQSLSPERQQQIRDFLRSGDQHPHSPGFFGQLRDLPPDQQDKVLKNDARFQSLPPERQQQIRENLQRWNAATPEQRQMLREREEIVESLSPEQRDQLRQIFPRWRQLPNDRRQALMQSFVKLRGLPLEQREKYLSSPEVLQQFSPEERSILSELGNLLPKN